MRALVVTNMYPSQAAPALGSFVRDQVRALRRIDGLEVTLHAFAPGARSYPRAYVDLRARFRGEAFDVVHAHFGLSAWPALAVRARARAVTLHGNDLYHPRSRAVTRAVLGRMDLVATPTAAFAREVPGAEGRRAVAVLPCGIDTERFRPLDRRAARERLGLDSEGRYVLFPYDPTRAVKRIDLALELAGDDARVLTLGRTTPEEVPLWVNAANAVVCPADWETFGLAALEALACDVPVLARPTGAHAFALDGIDGCHCGPFDRAAWRAALAPHLAAPDPRVAGRDRALLLSADRMAARVAVAWAALLEDGGEPPLYSGLAAPVGPDPGARFP